MLNRVYIIDEHMNINTYFFKKGMRENMARTAQGAPTKDFFVKMLTSVLTCSFLALLLPH